MHSQPREYTLHFKVKELFCTVGEMDAAKWSLSLCLTSPIVSNMQHYYSEMHRNILFRKILGFSQQSRNKA